MSTRLFWVASYAPMCTIYAQKYGDNETNRIQFMQPIVKRCMDVNHFANFWDVVVMLRHLQSH